MERTTILRSDRNEFTFILSDEEIRPLFSNGAGC